MLRLHDFSIHAERSCVDWIGRVDVGYFSDSM